MIRYHFTQAIQTFSSQLVLCSGGTWNSISVCMQQHSIAKAVAQHCADVGEKELQEIWVECVCEQINQFNTFSY